MRLTHPFEPVYDKDSRILILGSFPSVKSRDDGFYYGHPRNRFWKVAAALLDKPVPDTVEQKKALLTGGGIALWDVCSSCEVSGSSDASIRNAAANDIGAVLNSSGIRSVYANGTTAFRLYNRLVLPLTGIEAVMLPSTSPANASMSLEQLIRVWGEAIGLPDKVEQM